MIIDWIKVQEMNAEEIENVIVELEKEVQTLRDNRAIVQDELNEIKRQMILLEQKKHEYRTAITKSNHTIQQKMSDIEILRTKFWQKRR